MSGPSGHPGVVILKLGSDIDAVTLALETALGDHYEFLFVYRAGTSDFAVFAQGYK